MVPPTELVRSQRTTVAEDEPLTVVDEGPWESPWPWLAAVVLFVLAITLFVAIGKDGEAPPTTTTTVVTATTTQPVTVYQPFPVPQPYPVPQPAPEQPPQTTTTTATTTP